MEDGRHRCLGRHGQFHLRSRRAARAEDGLTAAASSSVGTSRGRREPCSCAAWPCCRLRRGGARVPCYLGPYLQPPTSAGYGPGTGLASCSAWPCRSHRTALGLRAILDSPGVGGAGSAAAQTARAAAAAAPASTCQHSKTSKRRTLRRSTSDSTDTSIQLRGCHRTDKRQQTSAVRREVPRLVGRVYCLWPVCSTLSSGGSGFVSDSAPGDDGSLRTRLEHIF